MAGAPDPKPPPRRRRAIRTVDRGAMKRARRGEKPCVSCGRRGTNSDHVVPKGSPWFGDDVDENLVVLCGTGTSRCHGAKHGIPYVDEAGERWTPSEVRRRIGAHIRQQRPDVVTYVLTKLGEAAGRDYLARRFLMEA